MTSAKPVLGIVGSPNKEGRTNQVVSAALKGAAEAGAQTELVHLADHVTEACKDCLPWVCMTNLKCSYEDPAFEYLSEKILKCGALVLGTPVYWGDSSAMLKYLVLKMFRVYARSAPLHGLPAFGIAIAGGTGNGLVSGVRPLYHFFNRMQMRALEPLPVTRFDFDAALARAEELGTEIAGMRHKRHPFAGLEQRSLWYDNLPYLRLNLAGERRLLAALTAMARPGAADTGMQHGLARADVLEAAGRQLESQIAITRVYDAGAKAFDTE